MLNKDYVDGLEDLVKAASKYNEYDGRITREYLEENIERVVEHQRDRFIDLIVKLDECRPKSCENLYCEW